MKNIILMGGGGHCHSCIDVIESGGIYQIKGIVLPVLENSKPILGYPVIGTDHDLPELLKQTPNILICIGQVKDFQIRKNHFEFLKKNEAIFPTIVSANAYCSPHSKIGEGTVLMHNTVVNTNVQIGLNCIVNSKSLIEHDVLIEDHCHISTGAIINGGVQVGMGSFIGSGSVIKQEVKIGKHVVIGAGQIVLHNVPDGVTIK